MMHEVPPRRRRKPRGRPRRLEVRRRPTSLWLAAAILALATVATPALAKKTDRIHVADIVIVGEVKSLERGRLKIGTDFMGTVDVDWEQVQRVESKLWFEVEIRDGTRHFGTLVASGEDRVLAIEGEEATVRLPFSELVTVNQAKAGFWGKIDASVALGFSFVEATDTTQASLDAGLRRRTGRFFSSLDLLSVFSETGDDSFTRNDFSYTAERALPGRWTYDAAAEFQTNESLGLDKRWLVRGSALLRAYRSNIRELSLGAGLAATREEFTNEQPGENSWEGRLSLEYHAFHFDNPELQVSVLALAYPSLTVSGRWRAQFNSDVQRELGWDLFWRLSIYWSYDNKPVGETVETSDLAVTASLGWSL